MSGSRRARPLKISEMFALVGGAIIIVAVLVMGSMLAWPKIQANWFPGPTPVVDIRPLIMTNEEMNGCSETTLRTIVPSPYDPQTIVPAVTAMQKSGVIGQVEGLLTRITNEEAIPYWTWAEEYGLQFTLLDLPASVVYRLSLYCITETTEGVYPLYDTVEVEKFDLEEVLPSE